MKIFIFDLPAICNHLLFFWVTLSRLKHSCSHIVFDRWRISGKWRWNMFFVKIDRRDHIVSVRTINCRNYPRTISSDIWHLDHSICSHKSMCKTYERITLLIELHPSLKVVSTSSWTSMIILMKSHRNWSFSANNLDQKSLWMAK